MENSVLKNRDFLKLWAGQGVSVFGSLVSRLALPFIVIYTLSASPVQIALLRVSELLPGILFGLFAGVWIDRLPRRSVMIVADTVRALFAGLLPVLLFVKHLQFVEIVLIAIVMSVSTVTFDSAYGAYIPSVVGQERVVDANGKLSATEAIGEVVGFGISGALFEFLGGAFTMSIDALTFIVSAATLIGIRKPEAPPSMETHRQHLWSELRQGVGYLRKNSVLSRLAGIASVQNLFYGISGTVYMLYISRNLQIPPGTQGVLYAIGGVGTFITANLVDWLFKRVGFGRVFLLVTIVGAAAVALLPLAFGPTWVILFFILGQQLLGDGADTVFEVGISGFRQVKTEQAFLGRVNSIWQVLTWSSTLFGTVLGGELATLIGLRNTLFISVGIRVAEFILVYFSRVWKIQHIGENL